MLEAVAGAALLALKPWVVDQACRLLEGSQDVADSRLPRLVLASKASFDRVQRERSATLA